MPKNLERRMTLVGPGNAGNVTETQRKRNGSVNDGNATEAPRESPGPAKSMTISWGRVPLLARCRPPASLVLGGPRDALLLSFGKPSSTSFIVLLIV